MGIVKEILETLQQIRHYSMLGAKQLLTLEEAADYVGLSKDHLYKLTSQRLIPHYKPRGKTMYFDKSELDAWMMQGKVSTIEEINNNAINHIATGYMRNQVSR